MEEYYKGGFYILIYYFWFKFDRIDYWSVIVKKYESNLIWWDNMNHGRDNWESVNLVIN